MPTCQIDDCAVPVVELSQNTKGGYTLNVKELEAILLRKDIVGKKKLLFLIRDWPYSDDHEYGFYGGAEYVEDLLKTTRGQKKELQTLRQNLGNSFETIQGFLLPHPGQGNAKNNSEKLLGKVEEDFEEQIKDFKSKTLFEPSEIEPKKIAGCEITCGELFQLFKSYINIFNSDTLPEPKSILEAIAIASNIAAEESAKATYDVAINDFLRTCPDIVNQMLLEIAHSTTKKAALKEFDYKSKLGEADLAMKHRNNLSKHIENKFTEVKSQLERRRKTKEEEKKLAEEKKRMEEQRKADEAKAAAERERLRREKEEQERRRSQMEEEQRRRNEEYRRREEQRQRDEATAWERLRQAEKSLLREQDHLAAERIRMQLEESRQEEMKRQLQREQEEAERRERQREAARASFQSPPSCFGGYSENFGSGSSSSSSGFIYNEKINRWHDRVTGRFVKTPKKSTAANPIP